MTVKEILKRLEKAHPDQQVIISNCEKGRTYAKLDAIAFSDDSNNRTHLILYPGEDRYQDPWDVFGKEES